MMSPLVSTTPVAGEALQEQTLQGVLEYVFGDSADGSIAFGRYFLFTGLERIELLFEAAPWHGLLGKQVVVGGAIVTAQGAGAAAMRVTSISLAKGEQAVSAAVTGTRKVILLLVKYSGDAQEPHPASWYANLINPSSGNTVNSFYSASSWGQFGWQADATNWMTLPSPKATYANCGWNSACANVDLLFNHAVALGAANGVNFNLYDNIGILTNNDLDCCSWGGQRTYSGKTYGVVWVAPWGAQQGTFVHELGHSIGLPHSGWVYYAYDSPWDVMSKSSIYNPVGCGTYSSANDGWATRTIYCPTPEDIIAPYKDLLGWIDSAHLLTVAAGSSAVSVGVDTLAAPLSASMKMIKVCVAGYDCTSGGATARYYTVEARTHYTTDPGFDYYLQNEGVIIHFYQGDRPPQQPNSCFFNAQSGPAYPIDNFNVVPAPHYVGPPTCSETVGGQRRGLYYANWNDGQTYDNGAGFKVAITSHSAVGSVTTYIVDINPGLVGTVEIAYDDGTSEDARAWSGAGGIYAVRFTPTVSGLLKTVRFYIHSSPAPVKIHIMDQSRTDIVTPFSQTPSMTGWFDVDVSPFTTSVTPGVDFYVGMESTVANAPDLGGDTNNLDARSWNFDGTTWYQPSRDHMIRAVIQQSAPPPPTPLSTAGTAIINAPAGDVYYIYPATAQTGGVKDPGVIYASAADWSATGFVGGMSANTQNIGLDSNGILLSTMNGQPLSSAIPTGRSIVMVSGPVVHAGVHFYEGHGTGADEAPIYFNYDASNFNFRRSSDNTVVGSMPIANAGVGQDVFMIEIFTDANGRTVMIMYGFTYLGTLAASTYFKFVIAPSLTTYTDSYYVYRWTDASSGVSANGIPDMGDTYIPITSG